VAAIVFVLSVVGDPKTLKIVCALREIIALKMRVVVGGRRHVVDGFESSRSDWTWGTL